MLFKKYEYIQISPEKYEIIQSRYKSFIHRLNDVDKEPITVFDPLPQKIVDELELIREVSKDLQKKKEEDMNKAAQAAKEAEELAKKKEEETAEAQKEE